jgi:hypothetical protein
MRGDQVPPPISGSTCRFLILGLGLLLLAGCNGGTGNDTASDVVPTRTLVPATPTATIEPITLVPSPTDLPAPSTLALPSTEEAVSVIPSVAQQLINRTMDDLLSRYDVDPAEVRLIGLEAFVWQDETWGCTARDGDAAAPTEATRGYRVLFGVGQRVFVYHTDNRDTFILCRDRDWLALEGTPLPVDPIAESMVDLTTRDAAKRLDVSEARVKLVSLLAVDWPNASLGCPKPNANYEDQAMSGYRIVLRASDEELIYHTSIRHFVRCEPEEEILPGALRHASPTTPE